MEGQGRARAKAAAARGVARAVVVERLTSVVAAGRFRVPAKCPGFELLLNVAPVLAADLPEAGLLVLSGQHVVVSHVSERGSGESVADRVYSQWTLSRAGGRLASSDCVRPTSVLEVWGAESTFEEMSEADWSFVLRAGRDVPVPAHVTSHLRCLAFYVNLVRGGEVGAATLQRWAEAIAAVEQGAEVLGSVFGGRPSGARVRQGDADLTFEQVLAIRNKGLAWSWMGLAESIVGAARKAHRLAAANWEERCPVPEPEGVLKPMPDWLRELAMPAHVFLP